MILTKCKKCRRIIGVCDIENKTTEIEIILAAMLCSSCFDEMNPNAVFLVLPDKIQEKEQ